MNTAHLRLSKKLAEESPINICKIFCHTHVSHLRTNQRIHDHATAGNVNMEYAWQ